MNRLNKTESAVFRCFRFSLFLKDPFFPGYVCVILHIIIVLYGPSNEIGI